MALHSLRRCQTGLVSLRAPRARASLGQSRNEWPLLRPTSTRVHLHRQTPKCWPCRLLGQSSELAVAPSLTAEVRPFAESTVLSIQSSTSALVHWLAIDLCATDRCDALPIQSSANECEETGQSRTAHRHGRSRGGRRIGIGIVRTAVRFSPRGGAPEAQAVIRRRGITITGRPYYFLFQVLPTTTTTTSVAML